MKPNLKPHPGPERNAFISELSALRSRAREQMMKGAVTPSFPSRRMLESILAKEEEHAEDLVDLLEDLPKD